MTIDERIEALSQSVELLSHMRQDDEKNYTAMFRQLVSQQERLASQQERLVGIIEKLADATIDRRERNEGPDDAN